MEIFHGYVKELMEVLPLTVLRKYHWMVIVERLIIRLIQQEALTLTCLLLIFVRGVRNQQLLVLLGGILLKQQLSLVLGHVED